MPVDSSEVDEATKQRWAVNYLRHMCTNYDTSTGLNGLLRETKGMVGASEMYPFYKSAVLDAISDAYPSLKSECERQKREAQNLPAFWEDLKKMADEFFGIRHIKR